MSKNVCKTCGATCNEERCWKHKKRVSLPKISKNKLIKAIKAFKESNEESSKMQEFFLSIWKERKHKSEISNEFLGNEALTIYFHHILPKSKVKEAQFDPENIILLTPDEHSNCESDMYRYEEINKRRIVLMRKYRPI